MPPWDKWTTRSPPRAGSTAIELKNGPLVVVADSTPASLASADVLSIPSMRESTGASGVTPSDSTVVSSSMLA